MRVSAPGLKVKSFDIPKSLVWEAYRRVAANKGAAGVDGTTLEDFEKDLNNNLYKIWNRMSSGSYFPPPVKAVEIPKPGGGTRRLGVPAVADRIAQTVVAMTLEARYSSCGSTGVRCGSGDPEASGGPLASPPVVADLGA